MLFLSLPERYGGGQRGVRRLPLPLPLLLRLLAQVRRLRETQGQQEEVRGGTYCTRNTNEKHFKKSYVMSVHLRNFILQSPQLLVVSTSISHNNQMSYYYYYYYLYCYYYIICYLLSMYYINTIISEIRSGSVCNMERINKLIININDMCVCIIWYT